MFRSDFHLSLRTWEGEKEQGIDERSERNAKAGLNEKKEICLISVFCKTLQMYSIVQKRSLSTSPSSKINNVKSRGTQASFFTRMAPEFSSWRFLSHHQAPISCLQQSKKPKENPTNPPKRLLPTSTDWSLPCRTQPETEPGLSCTWLCPQGSFLNPNQTIQSDTSVRPTSSM